MDGKRMLDTQTATVPLGPVVRCVLCLGTEPYRAIAERRVVPLYRFGNLGPVHVHPECMEGGDHGTPKA